ncbi:hypothetical protein QBC35DRAFT_229320 [Podospora australis]|uniref:Uncharacterized protein n=1 Tax=Podospora australis TaxID=1536484 RepID=A0AAN7AJ85_9PEZI|nr:hypothetical protein QBC35DRAFT_229320 [Podospora australis]
MGSSNTPNLERRAFTVIPTLKSTWLVLSPSSFLIAILEKDAGGNTSILFAPVGIPSLRLQLWLPRGCPSAPCCGLHRLAWDVSSRLMTTGNLVIHPKSSCRCWVDGIDSLTSPDISHRKSTRESSFEAPRFNTETTVSAIPLPQDLPPDDNFLQREILLDTGMMRSHCWSKPGHVILALACFLGYGQQQRIQATAGWNSSSPATNESQGQSQQGLGFNGLGNAGYIPLEWCCPWFLNCIRIEGVPSSKRGVLF